MNNTIETPTTTRLAIRQAVGIGIVALALGFGFAFILKLGETTAPSTQKAATQNEILTSDLVPGWPKPMPILYNGSHLAAEVTAAPGKELPFFEYGPGGRKLNLRSFDLQQQSGWPTPALENQGGPVAYWKSKTGDQYFAAPGNDYLYLYGPNGQVLPGWPVHPTNLCCVPPSYFSILDDLNNDDRPEVIWYRSWNEGGLYQNKIWVYDISGNPLPGWPVVQTATGEIDTLPAVGDLLPNVPGKEIVLNDSTRGLRLLTLQGTEILTNGWPHALGGASDYPTIVNLDGTGALEVLACEWNSGQYRIRAFRADSTEPSGWPVTNTGCYQSPFAADIDQDGTFEVIMNDRTRIQIWERDGSQPVVITLPQPADISPRVLDVNNQPGLEIIVATGRVLRAYLPNGTELQNAVWPKTLNGTITGFIAGDLRNDGTLDLLAFTDSSAYLFDLPSRAIPKNQFWPVDYGTHGRSSRVDQCVDGTAFDQCSDNPVLQRCVNGELRSDSTCARGPGGRQQVAP